MNATPDMTVMQELDTLQIQEETSSAAESLLGTMVFDPTF